MAILFACLFLSASTGLFIMEHYCGNCGGEEITFNTTHTDVHHEHVHDKNCEDKCLDKHQHKNHKQCDLKFFKVREPFLIKENNKTSLPLTLNLIYHFEPVIFQLPKKRLPELWNNRATPSIIYVNCQLLI